MPLLIYIHGFNSSPQSHKAIQTERWFAENVPDIQFCCPTIPPFADQALSLLRDQIEHYLPQPVYLIGSSMGGFFATCLAEQYNLKAVLINPAVNPARGLHKWVGENANYHTGETWHFEHQHIAPYREIDPGELKNKNNYLVLLQSGDEVLDYRDAVERYQGCEVILEQGGDHSFVGYERHLPTVQRFFDPA